MKDELGAGDIVGSFHHPSWKPPRAWTRVALAAIVIVGTVAMARQWPRFAQPLSTEIDGAREIVGYQLGADRVTMSLPPGVVSCRISTNLDLPLDVADAGIPYVVRVRVPEDGRDETFSLIGRPARDADGKILGFFRDRKGAPARTVSLDLQRTSTRPATLEVSLVAPGLASLRVFVAHERVGLGASPSWRDHASTVGGVAIDDLDPEVRDAYLSSSWTRQAARERTPTRTFYLPAAGGTVARPHVDRDQLIDAGRTIAVTVRGPGAIDVQAIASHLSGSVRVLDSRGGERRFALSLAPEARTRIVIGSGLSTVRVASDEPRTTSRLRLLASSANMLVDAPRPRSDDTLAPTWAWRTVARLQPDGEAVTFAAADRQQAAFRVTAWSRGEAHNETHKEAHDEAHNVGAAPTTPATLRWRFVDAHGALLANGKAVVDATAAPEDRLEAADGTEVPVGRSSSFFLWPPRSAHRLLIDGDRNVDVAVSSPGFDRDGAPAASLTDELADGIVMRNAPPGDDQQRPFYQVRPLNGELLQRAGRCERFGGAFRLEREEPRPLPPGPAVSLSPRRDKGRFVVLLPMKGGRKDAPTARRPGQLWTVRSRRDESITIVRPRGTTGAARVPATLMYELARPSGRQPLVVHLDGHLVRRASLLGIRGQVVLPPLPVGRHRLRIDLAVAARLFFNQPVAGAATYRRSQLYVVASGAMAVPLAKLRATRSLGVVMYLERPPVRGRGSVDVTVDAGVRHRVRVGMSESYTQLRRRMPLAFERAAGAVFLNHAGGTIWASRPLFIPLGDDLRAGTHLVSLRARSLGARPMARFFSYGGAGANRMNQHVEMSAELAQLLPAEDAGSSSARRTRRP